MNLADAIRLAAQQKAGEIQEEPMNQDPTVQPEEASAPAAAADVPRAFAPAASDPGTVTGRPGIEAEDEEELIPAPGPEARIDFVPENCAPEPPQGLGLGQAVRLELYLSPEQLKGLFSAIVGAQHSILTVREAAAYLRVQPTTLESMAEAGSVPALSIDGRWRFPKSGLDEWIVLQSFRHGGERNVA